MNHISLTLKSHGQHKDLNYHAHNLYIKVYLPSNFLGFFTVGVVC